MVTSEQLLKAWTLDIFGY